MRYGSLFSGFGGLDCAVEAVFGAKAAWHAEIEPAPCRVLEARWPGVPNLGDVSRVDWATVERPEILCGGFPCTDLSPAGQMAGLKPGTRSGLWLHFARAIRELRPELVVIENVRGLLSTEASHPAHQLGFCQGCLGDDPERVVLRALGAVLGDLADIGFDAEWCGLPASGVGAAHPRYRIVILAWPVLHATNERRGWRRGSVAGRPDERSTNPNRRSVAHSAGNGREQGRAEPAGIVGGSDAASSGFGSVAHTEGHGLKTGSGSGHGPEKSGAARDLPPLADADGDTLGQEPDGKQICGEAHNQRLRQDADGLGLDARWGAYGQAITRWGAVIGRPAPAPTMPGRNGQPKLSPIFVEWLMGLPAGWVTDVGVTTNEALKMLGNGVVPQQAEAGIRYLMERKARG